MQVKISGNESQVICTNIQAQEKAGESGRRKEAAKQRKNAIFAGDLPMNQDPIALRRQQAKKKAMEFVKKAWSGDQKMDQSQGEIRAKIREQMEEARANHEIAQSHADRIENLRGQYGVEEDSQEQKDLELLMKVTNLDFDDPLTEEEKERLEEMGPQTEYLALLTKKMTSREPFTEGEEARLNELEKSLTEYQRNCLEVNIERRVYQKRGEDAQNYAQYLQTALTDMKTERLKYHKMADAQKNAEKVMEQASEEIRGMLVEEAKDHVDETREEQREEAKKEAEEKEEQEEKIELRKEQQELMEVRIETAQENSHEAEEAQREQSKDAREEAQLLQDMVDAGVDVAGTNSAVKAGIKDMLNRLKLVEADIKGIEIDEEI